MNNDPLITVCAACFTASCWQGRFMCQESRDADITELRVSELRKLNLEAPDNWLANEELADCLAPPEQDPMP